MPDRILLDDPVLSDAEHGPCREHDDVGYAGKVCSKRHGSVQQLQAGQDTKDVARTQSSAHKNVMEVIPSGPEWRAAFADSADETGQQIVNWDRGEPEADDR